MSEINNRPRMAVISYWTLIVIGKRSGRPTVTHPGTKIQLEVEMERLARTEVGAFSHFICIESREGEKPLITVFESDR